MSPYCDKQQAGPLISTITDDIDAVQDFINSALLGIFVNLLTLVGMVGVMLWVSWRFALIALSVAPVLFFVVYWFTRRIKAASRAVRVVSSTTPWSAMAAARRSQRSASVTAMTCCRSARRR